VIDTVIMGHERAVEGKKAEGAIAFIRWQK
jgi:hypothetical protein